MTNYELRIKDSAWAEACLWFPFKGGFRFAQLAAFLFGVSVLFGILLGNHEGCPYSQDDKGRACFV